MTILEQKKGTQNKDFAENELQLIQEDEKERQLNQEEIKVTTAENKIKEQRNKVKHAKSLVKEKRRLLEQAEQERRANIQPQMEKRSTSNHHSQMKVQNTNKAHAHSKIDQLKKTIAIEKSRLTSAASTPTIKSSSTTPSTSPFISTYHSAQMISDRLQQLKINRDQLTNEPDYQKNEASSEEIISIMNLIIQALQEMMVYDRLQELKDELEKMNHFRQQIVTKTNKEVQDVVDKTKLGDQDAGNEILMAMTLVILHQHDGRILFEELKDKITDYATSLGLGSSLGSSVIYSWVGKEVFSIDRSQTDSFVQSNWK
ncbi:unnamed protein product [Absidia cylindrospora]